MAKVAQSVEPQIVDLVVAGSSPVFRPILLTCHGKFAIIFRNNLLGGVPKWPTGADCKSAGIAFLGSNPSPTTIQSPKKLGFFF